MVAKPARPGVGHAEPDETPDRSAKRGPAAASVARTVKKRPKK
jgi:hypothetical protein